MVTIIGPVGPYNHDSLDPTGPCHFVLETSVYDTSKAAPIQFSVICFLENSRRWQNVKTPPSGSFLSMTTKVVGRTTETNHLALRVLDLAYLSKPASTAPTPSSTTPSSKRPSRWEDRVGPSTPSKKPRTVEPDHDTSHTSEENPTTLEQSLHAQPAAARDRPDLPKLCAVPESPSTAELDESPLSSIPSPTSETATRTNRKGKPRRK